MARLVAIGDSMTQGFQSLAITHTELAFPALIAERMGIGAGEFRAPNFQGAGGLPCSIEWLARRIEDQYGADLNAFEWIGALHTIPSLLDEVEDYWERGAGSTPHAAVDYHNLAVWGFEAADAYNIDSNVCLEFIRSPKEDLVALPSEPRLRTAYRVLNPSQDSRLNSDTQLSIAERIQRHDSAIDHLILALGANNCLGTVVDLEIRETGATPPGPNSDRTLWAPSAFEQEYAELARRVKGIGARHTYVATVPHVTIPPVTRGVMANKGPLPEGAKYFDYYTRFFIRDKDFDPRRDPHLTGKEAKHIDDVIDQYNLTIRRFASQYGFHVIDLCALLDQLAVRRNHGVVQYPLPPALSDLSVLLFEIHPSGRVRSGGLISLDGVHPTVCGYSLIAQLFIDAMKQHEPGLRDIDFAAIRRGDPLVSKPPRTLDDMFAALGTLEKHFHLSRWLSKGFLRKR
jgi:hypothetical protein